MPRKKTRFTRTKKSVVDRPPTEDQWSKMRREASIVLDGVVFREKDDVVLHSKDTGDNVWVAKLCQIRIRRNKECWIRVKWYQSPRDIAAVMDNFDPSQFCRMERALSDQWDILRSSCLQAVTHVHEFVEEDLNPSDIKPTDFFQRYSICIKSKEITPIPGQYTCLPDCARPYNPFPTVPAKQKCPTAQSQMNQSTDVTWDTMHYCPRPSCNGRWYHRSCLEQSGYVESSSTRYVGNRQLRLLAVDPDADNHHPAFKHFVESEASGGLDTPSDVVEDKTTLSAQNPIADLLDLLPPDTRARLGHLPRELIQIAAQPIVRCAASPQSLAHPALGVFSTAGTIKDVVLARRLIYQCFEDGCDTLPAFQSDINVRPDGSDRDFASRQPRIDDWYSLSTTRILASPRHAYWRHRARLREPEVLQTLDTSPPLTCPQCGNAI